MVKNGKFTIVSIAILLIVVVTWVIGRYYRFQIYTPIDSLSKQTVNFVISTGENGALVGKRLAEFDLIRSSLAFRIFLRLNQLAGGAIQAGKYELSPAMNLSEIVEKFKHGTFDVKITIPEGLRIEQIAGSAISYQLSAISSPKDFLVEANVKNFSYEFLKDSPDDASLEGFLFPDTYFIPKDISAHDLIGLMLTNFGEKFDTNLREDLKKQNLNIFEAVIFASIVEREAQKQEDRPLVAGILIKRYKNAWPLEADATTQYAKANQQFNNLTIKQLNDFNWWPKELTEEDLKIDSPYNTRKYPGLPPGPIANPGLASIKAIVYPKESDFWYYVSDEKGSIYYSITYDEHLIKVAQYVQ